MSFDIAGLGRRFLDSAHVMLLPTPNFLPVHLPVARQAPEPARAPPLYEVIYASRIAPGLGATAVADITAAARRRNATEAVTGLLLFDGEQFVHQLEGPRHAVLSCIERIRADPRHQSLEVVHHGVLAARRFRRLALGFAAADHTLLSTLAASSGSYAVAHFMALLPALELGA